MRSVVTKIRTARRAAIQPARARAAGKLFRQPPVRLLALLALLLTGLAGCHRKLNYYDGKYRTAREMVALKRAARHGRGADKTKVKTKTRSGDTKVVTRRGYRSSSATGTLATVIETARSYQGTPYQWGGTTRLGLDCSGLLQLSFSKAGVSIPRTSNEQAAWGDPVKAKDLKPGDLVFFGPSPGSHTITHVGLVTVADEEGVDFIHASSSLGVIENSLESDYYLSRFIRAVRPRL